jgi:hypothetical protein
MTICLICQESVPDLEIVDGVCSVCRAIESLRQTLTKVGKIRRVPTFTVERVDRELPPGDR